MSGSSNLLLGSMHFMQSGELVIETKKSEGLDDVDLTDWATLAISQEFIVYALERDDWMNEFLQDMNNKLEKESVKASRPNLKLITGGKSED